MFSLFSVKNKIEKYLIFISALAAAALLFVLFSEKSISTFMLSGALFMFGFLSSSQILIWRFFSQIVRRYSAEKNMIGLAIALTNLIIMLFIALADLVLGGMISFLNHHGVHQGSYLVNGDDLQLVFYLLPSSMIIAAFLVFLLPSVSKIKQR
jgi:hypothetical protein